jgi:hypothetical protein
MGFHNLPRLAYEPDLSLCTQQEGLLSIKYSSKLMPFYSLMKFSLDVVSKNNREVRILFYPQILFYAINHDILFRGFALTIQDA